MPKWYWDYLSCIINNCSPEAKKLDDYLDSVRKRLIARELLDDEELTGEVDRKRYRLTLFYRGKLLCVIGFGGVEWVEI